MALRVYLTLPKRGINKRVKSGEVRIKKKEKGRGVEREGEIQKNTETHKEVETERHTQRARGSLASAVSA